MDLNQIQAWVTIASVWVCFLYCYILYVCMHVVPYRCSLGLGRFEQDSDGCSSFIQKSFRPVVLIYCWG